MAASVMGSEELVQIYRECLMAYPKLAVHLLEAMQKWVGASASKRS